MANTHTTSQFLRIAGVCAIIAPLIHFAGDLFFVFTENRFTWSIIMWAAFVLFVPAILGFAYYIAASGNRLGFIGGAFAFFGVMAGASMMVLFRVHGVLEETNSVQALEQLRGTFKLVAATQMIGLTFPIGLLLLSIGLFFVDRSKWLISVLLAIGAVAFPIGRIAGSTPAVIISGIMFIAAFGMIGKLLVSDAKAME